MLSSLFFATGTTAHWTLVAELQGYLAPRTVLLPCRQGCLADKQLPWSHKMLTCITYLRSLAATSSKRRRWQEPLSCSASHQTIGCSLAYGVPFVTMLPLSAWNVSPRCPLYDRVAPLDYTRRIVQWTGGWTSLMPLNPIQRTGCFETVGPGSISHVSRHEYRLPFWD